MVYGPIYAKVTNNNDPEKLGRVKVSFSLLGDQMESDWCDVMNSYSGSFVMPEIDDQVVVAFMSGSLSAGVILGGIGSGAKKPSESGEGSGMDFNEDGKNLTPKAKKGTLEFKKNLDIKAKEISIETKDEIKVKANKEIEINGNSTTIN